jgi:hypothetical protein
MELAYKELEQVCRWVLGHKELGHMLGLGHKLGLQHRWALQST